MSAILAELAEIFSTHGDVRCQPSVERDDDGAVLVYVRVVPSEQASVVEELHALELYHGVERLCDMAQLRALCNKYDINAASLERLLPEENNG